MSRQTLITDYYHSIKKRNFDFINDERQKNWNSQKLHKSENKIYGYNSETDSWHCLKCGIDMGYNNPRQLCGKTYCYN